MFFYLVFVNPNPLGCVQNRIQIGGFRTVRAKVENGLQEIYSNQKQLFLFKMAGRY